MATGNALNTQFPFIVGASGYYTTIQAAINAAALVATSTDEQIVLVNPGTYTENLSLKSFVNVSSFGGAGDGVKVIGNAVYNALNDNENLSLNGIFFETPGGGGIGLSVTGTKIVQVDLHSCTISGTTGTAFSCTNASATVFKNNCHLFASAGQKICNATGGTIRTLGGYATATDTASTLSGSTNFAILSCFDTNSFTVTGTVTFSADNSVIIAPGTLPFLNLGAGCAAFIVFSSIFSNAVSTNYIEGAGSLVLGGANPLIGTATNIDPAIVFVGSTTDIGTIRLMKQSNAIDMNNQTIDNLPNPVSNLQVANKQYVDQTALNGTSVYAATTVNLTVTQAGAGIGATLTNAGAQALFALDGVNPPLNSNVLVKNLAVPQNEGIYRVKDVGSGITNWVLERATSYDTPTEINNTGLIIINNGTQAGQAWYNSANIVTVDTTPFNFSRFGTTGTVTSISAGTGITLTPSPITGTGSVAVTTPAINPNIMIGGNFDTNPWQRGTSFATLSANTFTADRYEWGVVGTGVVTVSKAADAPAVGSVGFLVTNCLKALVTTADGAIAAGDLYYFRYVVEGYDWTQLAQAPCTLTFWVKATVTGIYTLALKNSGSDQSYVAEYTVNATNTWELKTILIPASPAAGTWDYTNGIGVQIFWNVAAGNALAGAAGAWTASNIQTTINQVNGMDTNGNVFQLDLIKFEQGSTATAWQVRAEQQELSLCQRYYQSYGGVSLETMSSGWANTASDAQAMFDFVTTMRAPPTITVSAAGDFSIQYANTDTAATSFSVAVVSSNKAQFSVGCAAVLTVGQGIGFNAKVATPNARLMLSAEL